MRFPQKISHLASANDIMAKQQEMASFFKLTGV
jgi:hypothetical protein